ncbi:MAG: glycosyl hydrolase [Firmicutes bacterium HGW-Firmicutes-12]|jgi:spore germination protein YaaH|nr:MAG: glycosyl hydrolase [Firmicutes bacterium HGW-Firmicutes-12]
MNTVSPEYGMKLIKNRKPLLYGLLVVGILIIVLILYFSPSWQQQPLNKTEQPKLFLMGNLIEHAICYEEEELYLSYDFIKEYLDPTIQFNEESKLVIVTTEENVYHFTVGFKDGLQNLTPYSFTYPVIEKDETIYLPADPLKDYYDLDIYEDKKALLVWLHNLGQPIQQGKVIAEGKLRHQNIYRSPWSSVIGKDEVVSILKEEEGWYWVETKDGRMGYLGEDKVELSQIIVSQVPTKIYPPWNPLQKPVIVTWEHAGDKTVDSRTLGEMEGLQVVSPTWFHLREDGLIVNRADKRYVQWAHQKGLQVWGLFDNDFDPDLTHTFLHDPELRIKAIRQLLSLVELYELDGINLDFENMYLKDKEAYVQFVRELAPLLHEKERLLTVDVTFHSRSETWSMCYDRVGLAEVADYLMVMGYDENGSGSSSAGSVSSLPWVEKGLEKMLEEVSADKLILGIPFYTRLWIETIDEIGKISLTSKALSMVTAEKWIVEHNAQIQIDETARQHYVEVKEGDTTYRMWLEDEFSQNKRIELMKKYRLAGISAWRRGYEPEETWPLLAELAQRVW